MRLILTENILHDFLKEDSQKERKYDHGIGFKAELSLKKRRKFSHIAITWRIAFSSHIKLIENYQSVCDFLAALYSALVMLNDE